MSKTTKNILISLIAIALVVILCIGLILGNTNNQEINNEIALNNNLNIQDMAHEPVNGYNGNYQSVDVDKMTQQHVKITTANELKTFLGSSEKYGILANDIDLTWDNNGTSTYHFESGKILDGNGYSIAIKGVREFTYKKYGSLNYSEGEDNDDPDKLRSRYLPDLANTGVGSERRYSTTSEMKMLIAGGLVTVNEGTIKNVNFIWDAFNTSPAEYTSFWSTSVGLIAGYNMGTILNCSMTVQSAINYRVYYNYGQNSWDKWKPDLALIYRDLWTMRHSIGTLGGFVGTNSTGGEISKCKIALGYDLKGDARGHDKTWLRLFVGGIAGVSMNGSAIYDSTATGAPEPGNPSQMKDGNVISHVDCGSVQDNTAFSASGIICGSIAKADYGDPDRARDDYGQGKESITGCYASTGLIHGVIVYWKGKAIMNHGYNNAKKAKSIRENNYQDTSSGSVKSAGTIVGTADAGVSTLEGQGIVCGLAGDWSGTGTLLELYNIYYVNYTVDTVEKMPNITCGRYYGDKNKFYRGNFVKVIAPEEEDKYVSIAFDSNHKADVVYGINPRRVNDVQIDNSVVWTIDVKQNGALLKQFTPYKEVNGLKQIEGSQRWEVSDYKFNDAVAEYGIPSEAAGTNNLYNNYSYEFNAEYGQVVIIDPEFTIDDAQKPLPEGEEALPITEGSRLIEYEDKEFDGTKVLVPQINLYADMDKKVKVDTLDDSSLFIYYNSINANNTEEKNFVGDWEIKFASQGTKQFFIIDKTVKTSSKDNYIAFRADHNMKNSEDFIFHRKITPKAITCEISEENQLITGTYKNAEYKVSGVIPEGQLIANYDDVTVELTYTNDGISTNAIVEAGHYIVNANNLKAKTEESKSYVNYVLAGEIAPFNFEVTKAEVSFIGDPENESKNELNKAKFVYSGNAVNIKLTDTFTNDPDEAVNKVEGYQANTFYIKHSDIFNNHSNIVFNGIKAAEKPASAVDGKRTDPEFKNAGWFSYTIMLVDKKNFELKNQGKVVNSVKFYFEITKCPITFTAEAINLEYTGVYPKLTVDTETPATDDIKVEGKPKNGSKIYIATQFMTDDQTITKPGIQSGTYTVRIYLDEVNSINYMTVAEYIEINNVTIAKQNVKVIVEDDVKNALAEQYATQTYSGSTVDLHFIEVAARLEPSLPQEDARSVVYNKKYQIKKGMEWVNIDYAPKDVGEYKVFLTIENRMGKNVLSSYNITKQELFTFEITQKTVDIALKDTTIKYGDEFIDMDFTGKEEFGLLDDLHFVFNDSETQQPIEIKEPKTYTVEYKEVTGNDVKNYIITCSKTTATIKVVPREVTADFVIQGQESNTIAYDGIAKTATVSVDYGKQWDGASFHECNIELTRFDENGAAGGSNVTAEITNVGKYYYKVDFSSDVSSYPPGFVFSNYFTLVPNPDIVRPEWIPEGILFGVFEITPMEVTVGTKVVNSEIVYGDNPQPSVKLSKEFVAKDSIEVNYVYYLDGDKNQKFNTAAKPGTYTVGYEITGGSDIGVQYINNYTLKEGTLSQVTVSQKDINININKQQITYDDEPSVILSRNNNDYVISPDTQFVVGDFVDGDIVLKANNYAKGNNAGSEYVLTVDFEKSTIKNVDGYKFNITEYNGVVAKKAEKVELVLPTDLVYNGEQKVVTVQYTDGNPYELAYTLVFNGAFQAVDAGEYVVEISLDTDTNHTVSFEEGTNTFTITAKEINWNIITDKVANKIYRVEDVTYTVADGEIISAPVDEMKDAIIEKDLANVVFKYYVPAGTVEAPNAILDNVQIRLEGIAAKNYNIITNTKGKAQVAANKFDKDVLSINVDSNRLAYSGAQHLPVINGVDQDHIDILFRVFNSEDLFKPVGAEDLINAGIYEIKIQIKADQEYTNYYENKEYTFEGVEFVIVPKSINIKVTNNEVRFGDAYVGDLYDSADFTNQLVNDTDKTNITLNVTNKYEAGTSGVGNGAEIIYALEGTGIENYEISNPNATMKVTQREVKVTNITLAENLVYDGKVKTPVVTFDYAEMKPEQYEVLYMVGDQALDGKNVGEYIVKIAIKNPADMLLIEDENSSKPMTITKLTITPELVANPDLVYSGEVIDAVSVNFNNENVIITTDDYKITYTQGNKEVTPLNAGTYTASFAFTEAASANFRLDGEIAPVEFTINKLVVTVTMKANADKKYTGEKLDLVTVTFDKDLKPEQYNIMYKKGNEVVEPINAGRYIATFVLLDKNNIELAENVKKVGIEVAKIKSELNTEGLSIVGNYNKIVIDGAREGLEFTINNGISWSKTGIFEGSVLPNKTYEVSVRTITDQNHIGSAMEKIGEYSTGGDPTLVNSALDRISRKFTYKDIEILREAEGYLVDVKDEDIQFVNMTKLEKARKDKNTLIKEANEVINGAQLVGAKAGGLTYTGAAAVATAVTVSLAGIALAIAKKKMFF